MWQRGWQWAVWVLGFTASGCGGAVERNGHPNQDVSQPQDSNQDVPQPQEPHQQPGDVAQPYIEVRLSPWVAGISMGSYHYWLHDGEDALVAEGNLQVISDERYQEYRIEAPLGTATLNVTGNSDDAARIICEGKIGPFEVKAKDNLVLIPGFSCTDPAGNQMITPAGPDEP